MVNKEQKLQALKDFLEGPAFAHIDGHSNHDGYGCKGHDEAFTAKAQELLSLIEEENYGYEPKVIEVRTIRGDGNYDSRDLKSFLKALTLDQFRATRLWPRMRCSLCSSMTMGAPPSRRTVPGILSFAASS